MRGRQNPATLPALEMTQVLNSTKELPLPAEGGTDTARYDMPPILSAKGLTTRFVSRKSFWGRPTHQVHAVEDVSFNLYPGETARHCRGIGLRQVDHRLRGGRSGAGRRRGAVPGQESQGLAGD